MLFKKLILFYFKVETLIKHTHNTCMQNYIKIDASKSRKQKKKQQKNIVT